MPDQKTDLNIYLLKADVGDSLRVIKETDGLRQELIEINSENIGTLYVKEAYSNPPRWAKLFREVVSPDIFGKNSSAAAVIIIEIDGRIFALTFGQGRHLLNTELIENNFGLRVALNCVDPHSLRSIDRASFEAHPRQLREQSGKATELRYFGIDPERDLLRAVTGKPVDKQWGERVSGMDSLHLSLNVSLSSLKPLVKKLLQLYRSDDYKAKGFAFVDHMGEIKDRALMRRLDDELISRISSHNLANIWLSVPEIIDWSRVVGFKYFSKRSDRVYDVRLSGCLKELGEVDITKDVLLTKTIYCVDADHVPVSDYSIYRFIYAEIDLNGKNYIINNGKWYLIDHEFSSEINRSFSNIDRYGKQLPIYDDDTETIYNARVAEDNEDDFSLLDRQTITLAGALSPIEPADLYRRGKEFIHIKRYSGSSTLSHLFNQGLVSAVAFKGDKKYRKEVNKKLRNQHKVAGIENIPKTGEYKVVYAIISERDEDLSVPFFSKISLRHAAQRLESMGYAVSIAKISVSEQKRITKSCPPGRRTN